MTKLRDLLAAHRALVLGRAAMDVGDAGALQRFAMPLEIVQRLARAADADPSVLA